MNTPSSSEIVIRQERPEDIAGIFAVHAACFASDAEARLVDLLRQAGRLTLSLVAEVDGRVVGHVAFSPVTTSSGAIGAGLAPVAVLEAFRKRGIAALLIRKGLELLDAGWVVVLGEPAYYSRFGFVPASRFGLSDAYGGGDAFQVLELKPEAMPKDSGLVNYAPEFAIFE